MNVRDIAHLREREICRATFDNGLDVLLGIYLLLQLMNGKVR